jgi:hypothetical protein
MRLLVPALESSDAGSVTNYRGRRVAFCLGLVWVVWAVGLRIVAFVDAMYAASRDDMQPLIPVDLVEILPFVLVLGALIFGLADDIYGSPADKGFRGHLAALGSGRLTTGALKMLGIGLLAATTVFPDLTADGVSVPQALGLWVLQALGIALTANLVNLLDLRPGRALKAYSLLAAFGCALAVIGGDWVVGVCVAIVMFGPVIAVWGFDVGERGMLGDGGANAAGALVGWLIVGWLQPWWSLAIYVAIVLAFNVASERASFSAVIDGNAVLRWLDMLGRPKALAAADAESNARSSDRSAKTSPQSGRHDR